MLRTVGFFIGTAVGLAACSQGPESAGGAAAAADDSDWVTLFDGTTLTVGRSTATPTGSSRTTR